jgi:hypothetical protein
MKIFNKDGGFSKTSVILVFAWVITLFKYMFQGCVLTIKYLSINWAIVFNSGDAIAIVGAAAALYFTVHNIKINVGQVP